jgi:AAHS family 4-hydroxybenzoate transporter-like MFS transporter
MNRREVSVVDLVDNSKIGAFQIAILLLCGAIVTLDGFDAQALSYVAPALSKAWNLRPGVLGPVFSASLFGMMIGALAAGPLADRLGRKVLIVACSVLFGLGCLVTARADSLTFLAIVRFVTGLGLGGVMPNAIALTSEYSPARRRASMVTIMFTGYSLGSLLGGAAAVQLLPRWGWPSVFVVGGILPILLTALLVPLLPESLPVLARQRASAQRIGSILRRLDPAYVFSADTRFVASDPLATGSPIAALFMGGRAAVTILLWVMFAANLLVIYFLINWLPSTINAVGLPVATAIYVTTLYHVGAVIGNLTLGWAIDRFGAFAVLTVVFVIAGIAVIAIGSVGANVIALAAVVFAAGYSVVGAQNAANAAAAGSYPDHARATGVGWSLGIGRIGAIVGPILGGVLIAQDIATANLFRIGAMPEFVAALAAALVVLRGHRGATRKQV